MDLEYLLRQKYTCDDCTSVSRHVSLSASDYYAYHCDVHKPSSVLASIPDPPAPKVIIKTVTNHTPVVRVVKQTQGVYGLPYNPNDKHFSALSSQRNVYSAYRNYINALTDKKGTTR